MQTRTVSVYVICREEGIAPCKIGIAGDTEKRRAGLQTASPYPLIVFREMRFGTRKQAGRTELELHQRFSASRLSGEWFDVPPQTIDALMDDLIDKWAIA